MAETHYDVELDARGLLCPLPVLKARFAMDALGPGQILRVRSTDGGSVRDMAAFARQTGNELVEQTTDGDEFVFYLRKKVEAIRES
jgi:tRNA 2-thiouridine synthesizing protein A